MSIFSAWADILSEKNPYFGKHLFCKTKTDYAYKHRVQDFATGKNVYFNQCSKQDSMKFIRLLRVVFFSQQRRYWGSNNDSIEVIWWNSVSEFCFFSGESYFIKAIENFFPVFAYPNINTLGQGLGEFLTVMQSLDFVSGLHNWLEFSQPNTRS